MIRAWNSEDLTPLLALWLESTTLAHPFIKASYWQESEALVRDAYLPSAKTWVVEQESQWQGLISVMDEQFIGALFVRPQAFGQGFGKALINHVKQHFSRLSLEVYQQNERAVNFYHAQGFTITERAWQEETAHPTWVMSWQADQTPSA